MEKENNQNKEEPKFFAIDKSSLSISKGTIWSSFFDLFISTAITLLIAIFIRIFVLQPFTVSGESMEPTLHTKDYVFVDELTYRFRDPKRGEIVIFEPPTDTKFYIKRVIALPNESIEITEDRNIKIYNSENPDGFILKEDYIDVKTSEGLQSGKILLLKDDEYFVMGDNRFPNGSLDSRIFGPIHKSSIEGKAWVRLFPNFEIF